MIIDPDQIIPIRLNELVNLYPWVLFGANNFYSHVSFIGSSLRFEQTGDS